MLFSAVHTIYRYAQEATRRIPIDGPTGDIFGYLMPHLVMTWILLFSSHTQIALRTMGGNPLFWWGLAQQVWNFADEGAVVKATRVGRVWIGYALTWTMVSLVLWAGFYPPA